MTRNRLLEITLHIRRQTYHRRQELDADKNIINLKNGLYRIDEDLLTEHNPDYLSINQKPIIYDKESKCERFEQFINQSVAEGQKRTAIEAMAYTFDRDYPIEVFFILHGTGSNGKSVYTSVLTELHGHKHVSNVTFTQMKDDQFALSDLENRDLNIDNELGREDIKDTSVFKRLTGGSRQPVRIQRKNQRAYDTILYAKLFFNANKIPVSEDMTDAWNRRVVIIAFPTKFEGNDADPKLIEKLTTDLEKSGIFNLLMNHLREIRRNGDIYVNEKTIEERRLRYLRANDSVKAFIEEAIDSKVSTESDFITKIDFHLIYGFYCRKYRLPPENYNTFCKRIANITVTMLEEEDEVHLVIGHARKSLGDRDEKGKEKQTQCWTGIKLKDEYEQKRLEISPKIEGQQIL